MKVIYFTSSMDSELKKKFKYVNYNVNWQKQEKTQK
jgi:hypothetical protein